MVIEHTKVGIESHKSNGRVERVIGTIREGIIKPDGFTLEEKIAIIVKQYNKTYHSAIRCTPKEALKANYNATIENSKEGGYSRRFKRSKQEILEKGQRVFISKKGNTDKEQKSRFLERGTIH